MDGIVDKTVLETEEQLLAAIGHFKKAVSCAEPAGRILIDDREYIEYRIIVVFAGERHTHQRVALEHKATEAAVGEEQTSLAVGIHVEEIIRSAVAAVDPVNLHDLNGRAVGRPRYTAAHYTVAGGSHPKRGVVFLMYAIDKP